MSCAGDLHGRASKEGRVRKYRRSHLLHLRYLPLINIAADITAISISCQLQQDATRSAQVLGCWTPDAECILHHVGGSSYKIGWRALNPREMGVISSVEGLKFCAYPVYCPNPTLEVHFFTVYISLRKHFRLDMIVFSGAPSTTRILTVKTNLISVSGWA